MQLELERSTGSTSPLARNSSSVTWRIAAGLHEESSPGNVEPGSTGVPDNVMSSHPDSAPQRSRLMLTWLVLHRLVRRTSRNSKIVNASASCGALTSPFALTLGARSLARVSGSYSMGSSTTSPRLAQWSTTYATAE